ncbi:MAG TPA: hypothetical protein VLG76_00755 [Rhabdochlamydiaceae bacterium]|nr:hypothetical protein [Rhabdochlamydiaceae bacterium]
MKEKVIKFSCHPILIFLDIKKQEMVAELNQMNKTIEKLTTKVQSDYNWMSVFVEPSNTSFVNRKSIEEIVDLFAANNDSTDDRALVRSFTRVGFDSAGFESGCEQLRNLKEQQSKLQTEISDVQAIIRRKSLTKFVGFVSLGLAANWFFYSQGSNGMN